VSLNSGDIADTTITMVFQNPIARVIQGDLEIPLPEDAVVCGYAMGKLPQPSFYLPLRARD